MKNLKEHFSEIEHLPYEQRRPEHIALFESKSALSRFAWDIYAHNAYVFYQKNNLVNKETSLAKRGFFVGQLSGEHTKLLKEIFDSCQLKKFDPNYFDSDDNYEPRQNLHEDMVRVNNYYEPSDFLFKNFPKIIEPLVKTIEEECACHWRIGSLRIFAVKPLNRTQGFHIDGQPYGIRKVFFYPNGVSKELGSTQIITKDGEDIVIEGPPGTWVIFENNLIEHQAFSSLEITSRPTIEIDLVPDFETDPTIVYRGFNSWHPWFPLNQKNKNLSLNVEELNFDNVHERTLKRVAGLSAIYKWDNYKFSDLGELNPYKNDSTETKNGMDKTMADMTSAIKSPDILPENNFTQTDNHYYSPAQNFKSAFKQLVQSRGIARTLLKALSLTMNLSIKKLKPKKRR